jgi:hypothetical protein
MFAAPATAQGTLSVGLSFLNHEGTAVGLTGDLSTVVRALDRWSLAVVGEASVHRHSDFNESALMFQAGPRLNLARSTDRVKPYAQSMLGFSRFSANCDDCSSTDFVITVGGGADFPVNDKTNIRVALDFPTVMFEGTSDTFMRFWVGASFLLGQ